MTDFYSSCALCPRACRVNRLAGETGYCGETAALRLGAAVIHKGEEPPLAGEGGSGAIFVSGCNLGCAFCQNRQISQGGNGGAALGKAVTAAQFADICAALRDKGAQNINVVTGSHAIPAVAAALAAAKSAGALLPVVWNSSAYETPAALDILSGAVDIYLPDLKTLDSGIAARFFNAPDYPKTAAAAILKMIETAGAQVIVRHLILPGYLESTKTALRWFADNAAGRAQLSLMTQYTPVPGGKRPMPSRFLSEEEYEKVIGWLEDFGIEDGFCQELVTGSEWLPDFSRQNPFSSELSVPVWRFTG